MSKVRAQLSAAEIEEMYGLLDRKLERVGIESQPEVAARILELSSDPRAGLKDFAEVLRTDAAITARLLRVANSSFFAQRKPVTNIDRACVVLGIQRIKAVALGFYLSRAAAGDPAQALSRQVWGQSVFRAALASEIAQVMGAPCAPEAFVVGLLLDAGIPLLFRMLGEPYGKLLEATGSPARHFRTEFDGLPYTHVDVAAVLMRRWRLPELLARPVEWHHTAPSDDGRTEPIFVLHRIAYYVGAVRLSAEGEPVDVAPLPELASRHLGIDGDDLGGVFRRALREYGEVLQIFSGVADPIGNLQEIAEAVHNRLVAALDESIAAGIGADAAAMPLRFRLGGREVEFELARGGEAVAYVSDSQGRRLVSYRFRPARATPSGVLDALGLEPETGDQMREFEDYLRSLAA